jgi:hypothetical protein
VFQVVDVLFLLVKLAPMPPILVDLLNTVQYSTVHRLVLPRQRTINIAMAMLMIAKTMTLAIMKACTPCS